MPKTWHKTSKLNLNLRTLRCRSCGPHDATLLPLRGHRQSGPENGVIWSRSVEFPLFNLLLSVFRRILSPSHLPLVLAFRIHISHSIKEILDEIGGYHSEYRGSIEFEGGIETTSYWLISSDDFHKPLPEPPPLVE